MRSLVERFVSQALEWLFRRRSPCLAIMRIGFACFALSLGAGWVLRVSFPLGGDEFALLLDETGGAPTVLIYAAALLGAIMMVSGLVCQFHRDWSRQKLHVRKRVIVLEVRGLRDTGGSPLADAISPSAIGRRETLLVNLRQGVQDGGIVSPESAVQRLRSLPNQLAQLEGGRDRSDVTTVYGGLSPVPLTFLSGVQLDDEMPIIIYDWDRHAQEWRALDGEDDGARFRVAGIHDIPQGAQDVALAVSVSYAVRTEEIRHLLRDVPVVTLDLNGGVDCHWAENKQRDLGEQFLATVLALEGRGVVRIRLFLAAQNSVTFRFGRLYDRRNLPEIVVYQYDRSSPKTYPWGVLMPAGGVSEPKVVWT